MIAALEIHPLHDRCDNWGQAMRWRSKSSTQVNGIYSTKRGYGNAWHWDSSDAVDPNGVAVACAPSSRPPIDPEDANIIEQAVCSLDLFHHTLLRAWHVNRFNPHKCLRLAARAGEVPRGRVTFDLSLEAAYGLLEAALELPAVIRKDRARERVRAILGPQLQTVED